jgi:TIR domain
MADKHNVFISYARHDRAFADRLARALKDERVAGWRDNADVAAGADWGESVRDALKAASTVVLILSESALKSNWVLAEMGAAQSLGKRIVLVKPPNEPLPDPLPPMVDQSQVVRADDLSSDEIVARIRHEPAA